MSVFSFELILKVVELFSIYSTQFGIGKQTDVLSWGCVFSGF